MIALIGQKLSYTHFTMKPATYVNYTFICIRMYISTYIRMYILATQKHFPLYYVHTHKLVNQLDTPKQTAGKGGVPMKDAIDRILQPTYQGYEYYKGTH